MSKPHTEYFWRQMPRIQGWRQSIPVSKKPPQASQLDFLWNTVPWKWAGQHKLLSLHWHISLQQHSSEPRGRAESGSLLPVQGYSAWQLMVSQSKHNRKGNKEQCRGKSYIILGVLLSFNITSFPLILLFLSIKVTRRSTLFHGPDPPSHIRNKWHKRWRGIPFFIRHTWIWYQQEEFANILWHACNMLCLHSPPFIWSLAC